MGKGRGKFVVIAIKSHIDFQNIKILFFFFNFFKTFFPRILVRMRFRTCWFCVGIFFLFFCKWKLFTYIYEQSQWYWYLFDLILQRSHLFCILHKISREKILLSNKNIFKMFHISRNNWIKVLKNKEINMSGNKIISLQEFLKKKKLLTFYLPIEKIDIYIPFEIIFFE